MTKLWTVAVSARGFQAPLRNYLSSILADIAKTSGRKQDLAIERWDEFNSFVRESEKLHTGMTDLPASLRPVSNLAGRVIPDHYVLKVGTLRGYYQIDESSRGCLAKLFRANTDKAIEDLAALMLAPED